MRADPILIGPIGAGKSTVAELLSTRLGLAQCSLDDVRWPCYREMGYNEQLAKETRENEGFWGLYRYWKPFEAYAVERVLQDHRECVFDFGAGHSVYEDNALFKRVRSALAPYANIILLLPSPDIEMSLAILNERRRG